MTDQAQERSVFEQHAQTIISLGIVALLGWGGMTLNEMQKQIAGMSAQMATLQTEVSTLRQLDRDRYTSTKASEDWGRNREEMNDLRARVRTLEQKIR